MKIQIRLLGYSALAIVVSTLPAHPALAQAWVESQQPNSQETQTGNIPEAELPLAQRPSEAGVIPNDGLPIASLPFQSPSEAHASPKSKDALPAVEPHGAILLAPLQTSELAQVESTQTAPIQTDSAQRAPAIITDVQISTTPEGLSIVLVSDQSLPAGTSQVSGNAVTIEIPNAMLELDDAAVAEQFSPAEGIALVQVSSLPDGTVQVAITGTEAPPVAQISTEAGNLMLTVVPGVSTAETDDPDAIQVVVTATRTEEDPLDIPRSVTVIDREQLEQQLTFTNNLPDILGRLVPGLGAPPQTDRTNALLLRGRPVVILIDGVPQTPNNDAFATSLSTIDPAQVERIEVLRGPSAIYGDGGTGGIINIITRAPTTEAIAYEFGAGVDTSLTSREGDRFGYNVQFGVSGASEQVDGLLSLSYDTVNGQFDANGDRVPPNGINDNDRFGVLARLGVNLTDEQRISLSYSFFQQEQNSEFTFDNAVATIPGAEVGRALFIGSTNYDEPPQQTNHVVNLAYRHTDLLNSQFDAQFYYRDTDQTGIFTDLAGLGLPAFFPQVWQTALEDTEVGGRLQLDTPLGRSASVLWGVDYSQNRTASPLLISDTEIYETTRDLRIIDRSLDRFPSYVLNSLGIFAQGRWDITDQFQMSGGLRYENIDLSVDDYELAFRFPRERQGGSGNFDDVTFNAGLLYRPIPEIGLFASFAQGFSIPNIGDSLQGVPETFDVSDNLLLEPQRVDNYEIGLRVDFDRVQATLTGFYSESELGSSISLDPETGFGVINRSPQRNYGVEATLDWQPSDRWRLGGLISWNEGENDINDDGEFLALSSVEIQPIKVGLYLENETTPGWINRLDLLLVGDRDRGFDDNVDIETVGGYTVVDFSSSIQLGEGRLILGIGNLFNTQYTTVAQQVFTNIPQRTTSPGRTLTLRYFITF